MHGLVPVAFGIGPTPGTGATVEFWAFPTYPRTMKVRGERECQDCGTRWSYYETGSVDCPSCGSVVSVGVDERTIHTATPKSLDLTPARDLVGEDTETRPGADATDHPLRRVADRAVDLCGEFVRGYGFVHAGDVQPLDDTYLAAMELRAVADTVSRRMRVDDAEAEYFLELLRIGDQGDRPNPEAVPESLQAPRGVAYAQAVDAYRSDLRDYLEDRPDSEARDVLESLDTQVRRIRALEGDVTPREADRLVATARDVGEYLQGDEAALARARDRLSRLGA